MVFNILVDNTDDHEKNHSILVVSPWSNGRFRLAPAFDVLSSNSGQGFQEIICGDMGRDSTLENAMSGLLPNRPRPQAPARTLQSLNRSAGSQVQVLS